MGRIYVCNGAQMVCSMGTGNAMLVVLPERRILLDGQPQANIMDHKSMTNIPSFGLCTSLANPVVAAATAAHHGCLTPMPCVPNTTSPWQKGHEKLLLKNFPALCMDDKLSCAWAGTITIAGCGQGKGQGAFPLSKDGADGELLDKLFIKWDTRKVNVDGKVRLLVKSLDKNRTIASLNIVDANTNEVLKQINVRISDGIGKSEYINIPKEWESKIINAIEI